MRYLFDTQLLLLATFEAAAVPRRAVSLVDVPGTELFFSVASLWEIAIKFGRGKPDFVVDPFPLRIALLRRGYTELPISGEHVMYCSRLPAIHKDPFDRLLVAQATIENITLLTSDAMLAKYSGPIRLV
ncbi:MAG: type II toxin-antitoxin system VapC family toxin [Acidobacteriaceae bacterium]